MPPNERSGSGREKQEGSQGGNRMVAARRRGGTGFTFGDWRAWRKVCSISCEAAGNSGGGRERKRLAGAQGYHWGREGNACRGGGGARRTPSTRCRPEIP
eukprot:651886-Hanusia_phi.AAC.1